ncbi:MAG: hypothetical protein NZ737_00785 [Candidatus Poseidoniaceae archaeon]|nr:hypothetical protein [Candidatus Poseidoniaceae archaeon]
MNKVRLIVALAFIGQLLVFLTMQAEFDGNGQWGLVGGMVISAIVWTVLGDKAAAGAPIRSIPKAQAQEKPSEEIDIPEPVKDELDGATLRERKMAKVKAAADEETANEITIEPDDDDGLEEVEVTVEDVHVADEFVVEVSAQSIEDASIQRHIIDKQDRHDRIRARIAERRRGQMADIRASTAKMWEDHSSGEDLVTVIQTEGHSNQIIEEPAEAAPGHVYGASLVRIDESTILKLRVPLDKGFRPVDESKSSKSMAFALPEGMPSPADLGLPLPPPPGASGALAALRDEITDN